MHYLSTLAIVTAIAACGGGNSSPADATSADGATTVTQMVGASGGMITADGVALMIPAGALATDMPITITATTQAAPGGFTAASSIYTLEPAGLVFAMPVSLALTVHGTPAHVGVYWSKLGDASHFDALGGTVAGTTITASNTHFSTVFAGAGPAMLAADVTTFDFGSNPQAEMPTHTFTIANHGGATTGALAMEVKGANAATFVKTSDTCTGMTLEPEATCAIVLRFTATTAGNKVGLLVVSATPGGNLEVPLAGVAVGPMTFVLQTGGQTMLDFGSRLVGTTTSSAVPNNGGLIAISNLSTMPSGIVTVTITGPDAAAFAIGDFDNCTGQVIDPEGADGLPKSCGINVFFTPTSAGAKSATVTFSANPGGTVTYGLQGTGNATAGLSGTQPFVFGTTLGSGGITRSITITNDGATASGPVTISLAGPGAASFAITADACTGVTLAPAAHCDVSIYFDTTVRGWYDARLVATASPGGTAIVGIYAQALSQVHLVVTPSSVDFGAHPVGTPTTVVVTLLNDGDGTAPPPKPTFDGAAADDFTVASTTCLADDDHPLYSGSHCTFTLRFLPSAVGARTATLTINAVDDPMHTAVVPLSGTGT